MDPALFKEVFQALMAEYIEGGMNKSLAAAKALSEARAQLTQGTGEEGTLPPPPPFATEHSTPPSNICGEEESRMKHPRGGITPPRESPVKGKKEQLKPLLPMAPAVPLQEELTVEFLVKTIAECKASGSYGALIKPVYALFSSEESLAAAYLYKVDGSGSGEDKRHEKEAAPTGTGGNNMDVEDISSGSGCEEVEEELPPISIDVDTVEKVFSLLLGSGSEGVVNSLYVFCYTIVLPFFSCL
jgi:hypothetical protein